MSGVGGGFSIQSPFHCTNQGLLHGSRVRMVGNTEKLFDLSLLVVMALCFRDFLFVCVLLISKTIYFLLKPFLR